MTILRKNQITILAFMDILFQDSIADAVWYTEDDEQSNQKEIMKKVSQIISDKWNGREFGTEITVSKQVNKLISIPSDEYDLVQMYLGWFAFW
jgi:phosphatidylinositol kinase/protein kinase (PI-3  family)